MLFSSIVFLFYFLPIVLLAYFVVPKKAKEYRAPHRQHFFLQLGESLFMYFNDFQRHIQLFYGHRYWKSESPSEFR